MRSKLILFLLLASSAATASEYKNDENAPLIKGQKIEVGERSRYEYKAPTYNFDMNPFGIMMGIYSGSASIALNRMVNIRGDFSYCSDEYRWDLSLSSQIYFRKMYSGTFIEPGLVRRAKGNVFGPQVLVGYTWFWDSGMNMSFATGLGQNLNHYENAVDYSVETFGNSYIRVGFAF